MASNSENEGRRQINELIGQIQEAKEDFEAELSPPGQVPLFQQPSTSTQGTSRMQPSTSRIAENSRKRGIEDSRDSEHKKRKLKEPQRHGKDSDNSTQKDNSSDVGTPGEDEMKDAKPASPIQEQALGGPLALGIDQGLAQNVGLLMVNNTFLDVCGTFLNSLIGTQAQASEGENLENPAREDEMEEAGSPKLVRYGPVEPLSINISPASPGPRYPATMQKFLKNPHAYLKNPDTLKEICRTLEKREAEMNRNGESCPSTPRSVSASPAGRRFLTPEQRKELVALYDEKDYIEKNKVEGVAARLNVSPATVRNFYQRERTARLQNALRETALNPDMKMEQDGIDAVKAFFERSRIENNCDISRMSMSIAESQDIASRVASNPPPQAIYNYFQILKSEARRRTI